MINEVIHNGYNRKAGFYFYIFFNKLGTSQFQTFFYWNWTFQAPKSQVNFFLKSARATLLLPKHC